MKKEDSWPPMEVSGNENNREASSEQQGSATADSFSAEQFQAYSHLLGTLYGCLQTNQGFEPFFLAFREQFRNLQCAILGLTKQPIRMIYGWTHGYPEGFEQLFINSDLPAQDAALKHFSALPVRHFDSLCGCDPDVELSSLLTDATREWVEAAGLGDSAGMLVSESEDMRVVFLANRHKDEGLYTRQELEQLNLLAPHIENAVRLYTRLYNAREDNESLVAALDHVKKPMIVFNEMAQVVKCNEAAEALLRSHPGLAVSDTDEPRLQGTSRRFNRELDRAIITAIINARKGNQESTVVVNEYAGDRVALCITPLTDSRSNSHGALAELFSTSLNVSVDQKKLHALFECTDTEARIAVHLMQGHDARTIAELERLSLHTVRQHIKSLLSKNGFHRQVELVAALIRALG